MEHIHKQVKWELNHSYDEHWNFKFVIKNKAKSNIYREYLEDGKQNEWRDWKKKEWVKKSQTNKNEVEIDDEIQMEQEESETEWEN